MYDIKNHWLVLTRPEVAGFQAPRDTRLCASKLFEPFSGNFGSFFRTGI
jgi:hypothetical protein